MKESTRQYVVIARLAMAVAWVVLVTTWQTLVRIHRANRRRHLRQAARRWA